jgi:polyphenol oxidase
VLQYAQIGPSTLAKGANLIKQQREHACFLQFNQYLQFPEITHGVFTRLGGYSTTPYAGLNASYSTGDSFDNVVRNRLAVLQALDIADYPCATLWQVHGADVAVLDTEQEPWDDWRTDWAHRSYYLGEQGLVWTTKARRKADAIITRQVEVALALSFADCSPLLFYDPVQCVIGLAHAGWRGTARGVALATVEAMTAHYDCQPRNILAAVAPSIAACCYEVSEQVQCLFMGQVQFDKEPTLERYSELVRASAVFSTQQLPERSSLRLDIRATNHNQLLMAGILPKHIEMSGICTGCNTDLFFSHRVEQGKTGRFPVVLALKKT